MLIPLIFIAYCIAIILPIIYWLSKNMEKCYLLSYSALCTDGQMTTGRVIVSKVGIFVGNLKTEDIFEIEKNETIRYDLQGVNVMNIVNLGYHPIPKEQEKWIENKEELNRKGPRLMK